MFYKIILTIIIVCNISNPVIAAEKKDNTELLSKIENYLNNISSIKSNFIQLNPDNSINEGVFYLLKPGKFRWEYQNQPIIIVANGKSLIYYDTELEQINYVPIEQSIASLLIRNTISFTGDLKIIDLTEKDDSTRITLVKKNQKDVGEFSFVFQNKPFKLGKIELIDNNEQRIIVTFFDMELNPNKIDKKLFKIKDPRLNN